MSSNHEEKVGDDTKPVVMQLASVPLILNLQNVKQALLTTTTSPSGDVTRSVVLTLGSSENDRVEKGTQATQAISKTSKTDIEAPDSPPTVPMEIDSSQVTTIRTSSTSQNLPTVRTIHPVYNIKTTQASKVKRLASGYNLVKQLPLTARPISNVSVAKSVKRVMQMNAIPVITLPNKFLEQNGTQLPSSISGSTVPKMEPIQMVTVKKEENANTNNSVPVSTLQIDLGNDSTLHTSDTSAGDFQDSVNNQCSKEVKDYKTTPLKKRPLIIPRESYSSTSDDNSMEVSQPQMSSKKFEMRRKVDRKSRPKRKQKNADVKQAERFVMVNRGVLEGLMDHVKSSAEAEEAEMARRFQKDCVKKCDYCDRTFNYFSKLVEHIRSHTKIRPYVCGICDSRFKYKGDLMVHIKQHSEDKPFECDCGRRFATKKYLNVHIRQAAIMGRHPAARPFSKRQENSKGASGSGRSCSSRNTTEESEYWLFECQECGKRFTSKTDLLAHVKKHTNMEPVFECNSCGVKFEDSNRFERHMLEHS